MPASAYEYGVREGGPIQKNRVREGTEENSSCGCKHKKIKKRGSCECEHKGVCKCKKKKRSKRRDAMLTPVTVRVDRRVGRRGKKCGRGYIPVNAKCTRAGAGNAIKRTGEIAAGLGAVTIGLKGMRDLEQGLKFNNWSRASQGLRNLSVAGGVASVASAGRYSRLGEKEKAKRTLYTGAALGGIGAGGDLAVQRFRRGDEDDTREDFRSFRRVGRSLYRRARVGAIRRFRKIGGFKGLRSRGRRLYKKVKIGAIKGYRKTGGVSGIRKRATGVYQGAKTGFQQAGGIKGIKTKAITGASTLNKRARSSVNTFKKRTTGLYQKRIRPLSQRAAYRWRRPASQRTVNTTAYSI